MVPLEGVTSIGELPQRKKRFVCMVRENFDMFSRGRHVMNGNSSMMRLHHKIIIGQFHVDGGGRWSWCKVVNRSGQRPRVGSTTTIDGRVIIVQSRYRAEDIRITIMYIRFK